MKMSSFYICVSKITIIWCMLPEIWVQSHNFLSFWVIFCPFTPLLAPKIKNWKKIRRYFLFHMCTINKDSWDIRHNRQKFLSFWAIFYPFIPLTNQKSKSKKNEKKTLEIFLFYICLPRMTIIWCTVPEIWSYTGKIFSHFGPFFALLLKNQNFEKTAWRYHQLTLVYHKWQSYDVWFLRYKVQRTEFFVDYFLPFWPPPP